MNIYILDPIHNKPLSFAKENGKVITWNYENINNLSEAEALIVRTSKVTKDIMLKCPKLKIIAKHGIGTDNIDLDAAKELGIIVTNTPTANLESVAELVVALTMSCFRNVAYSYDMVREGLDKVAPEELTGLELYGKTVGFIGLGRIGQRTGNIFKNGFEMNIIGYDPFMSEEKANEIGIKKYDNLKEMLADSDIVSINVPLLPSTVNLIGRSEFDVMKKSAILINTSRGKIVNEADLYEALRTKRIRAAALDVFEIEPPTKDNPLLSLNNFVGTPHIGAATEEALIRMGQTAVEEIIRVRDGLKPIYEVK